jgi:hypothetical protein
MRRAHIAVCGLVLGACASTPMPPVHKPRLVVTVESSRAAITSADIVTLTLRAKNIGDIPLELANHVEGMGAFTVDFGAGRFGLMSPDYAFKYGGPVSSRHFAGFRLEPGEERIIQSEFQLQAEEYTYPDGIYFADAILDEKSLNTIDVKIIPMIVRFTNASRASTP